MPTKFNIFTSNYDLTDQSGGLTPVVAIVGDSGEAVPTVDNKINILGDKSTANNVNGITVAAGVSTVTITLTNRITATVATSGAVTGDLVTFDLASLTTAVVRFNFEVVGRDATATNGVGYSIKSTFLIAGGVATRISSAWSVDNESTNLTGSAVDMIASGTNVILRVTGTAAFDLAWTAIGSYIVG